MTIDGGDAQVSDSAPPSGPAPDGGERGARRWTMWALIASVSANLLVAGLWAGHAMREEEPGSRSERIMLRLLPPEHHDRWRAEMADAEPEIQLIRQRISGVHSDIVTAIGGDTFEIEALAKAFEQRRDLSVGLRAIRHNRLVRMTSEMSPEQRRIFAERMDLMARRWAERRKVPPPGER